MLECNETDAVRHRVVAEMDMVVEREGTEEEKSTWNQLSGQRKLNYSLTTASLLPTPTEAKVKMAGARQWVLGMREAAGQLHRENDGYEHMVEREAASPFRGSRQHRSRNREGPRGTSSHPDQVRGGT